MEGKELITAKCESIKSSFKELDNQISINGVLLTDERLEILSLSFQELKSNLRNDKLSAVEVLRAYQAKALSDTRKYNCITEFIPEAEKWAKALDEIPLSSRGALHGIPLSVKENFDIIGMDTTIGLTKKLNKPAKSNAVLVDVLRHQGGLPFCKTNVSQLIFSVCCTNPIFGRTLNPIQQERSSGGSSGGEACLIKTGGSILGLGTDLGGSVRIPASFCGVYSFKPTQARISQMGFHGTYKEIIGVKNSAGFLSQEVDSMAEAMKALTSDTHMSNLDPQVPSILWQDRFYTEQRKLKIGFYNHDGVFPPTPSSRRAVKEAKEALEKLGHTLVPFTPPGYEAIDIILKLLASNEGVATVKLLDGDVVGDHLKATYEGLKTHWILKRIYHHILKLKSPLLALLTDPTVIDSPELWKLVARQKTLMDSYISSWKEAQLDVLLCPAFPSPAILPKYMQPSISACSYFVVFNLLDFPCGTITVTKENEMDQELLKAYPEYDLSIKTIKESTKGALGLPVSVQLAGLPWYEETVLYAMRQLEKAMQG